MKDGWAGADTRLAHLCRVAQRAGAAIIAIYAAAFEHWTKPDDSPLTQADLASDAIIREGLGSAFPGAVIWSEESAAPRAPMPAPAFFLVDPLDGTKEFIARNDEFTVNIALIEDGRPVAGVVYAPALDQLYFAAQGVGAFRRDAHGDVPLHTRAPATPLRVIGSRSHGGEALAAWLRRLACDHTFVAAGSSLKFCRIAEGQADVYPRMSPTCQWDTAAGQAVLECAGGAVLDAAGDDLHYGLERPVLNPHFIALARRGMRTPAIV